MAIGRPRSFDTEQALDRALQVFWRKGYEGSSLADLTTAMGINPPSLYAAFGNKAGLFRKALDRYTAGPAAYVRDALDAPAARDVVGRLLQGAIDLLTDKRHPSGCLLVQGALACGEAADEARQDLIAQRIAGQAAIRKRFERAKAEHDLPAGLDPSGAARYISTVLEGMAVEAASGASRKQLQAVAEIVLRAWPA